MAYILTDKDTGAFLVVLAGGTQMIEQTDDQQLATSYQRYEEALEGMRYVNFYSSIDVGMQIFNGSPNHRNE